jgi:YjbE family integral membrane protein
MDLDFSTWIDAFKNLPNQFNTPGFWARIAQIVWMDLLLAGDNALVIALACRKLPARQRVWGIVLGGGLAVLLRIVFALAALKLSSVPYLQLAGGLALIWIAIRLLVHDDGQPEQTNIRASRNLWKAVWIIGLADLVMSLDNVIAIVGVSGGNPALIIIGIAASIPLIFIGAELLHNLITRAPALVWAGSLLLIWIAARMILEDAAVKPLIAGLQLSRDMLIGLEIGATAVGAFILLVVVKLLRAR